jgi:phosphate transport system protein
MTRDTYAQHTSSRFDDELEKVRARILHMGGLVEKQLNQAVGGLVHGEPTLAALIAEEEREVNQLECVIDEDCSRILATRAPAASDLRLIIGILKVATDLERVGDESKKIGRLAVRLTMMDHPSQRFGELRHLAHSVASMLHDTLDALARHDADAALVIVRRDRLIDEEYESIQRQSITFMMEDPRAIRRSLDVMWAVRALERIGDHAKNICEHLIYIVRGTDVRHARSQEAAATPQSPREPNPPV